MSNKEMRIRKEDLTSNPTARVPICLCLDTSGSMSGQPINELTGAVRQFFEEINADEMAHYSAEICLVTFGGRVECIEDFANIDRQNHKPSFAASGDTPMGEAVGLSLELLAKRKAEYQDAGVDYYQPWLVLMTDGQPNGDKSILNQSIADTVALVNNRKLTVFPIGIGADADMNTLSLFSPNRSPVKLQGLKFKNFFSWLSQSISRVSMSMPGEAIKLDLKGMQGWAEL